MKNNNIPITDREFENFTKVGKAIFEVSGNTIPVFLDNLLETVKKHKIGHAIEPDLVEFMFMSCESMSFMLLESLEKSHMFKQFEDNDYKIKLMEKVITRHMAHLAGLKEKREHV